MIRAIDTADLKDYKITQQSYNDGHFGVHPVLARVNQNDDKKQDRFYVMALNDIDNKVNGARYSYWYGMNGNFNIPYGTVGGEAISDYFMSLWNEIPPKYEHNAGDFLDVWGQITAQYDRGWFIPGMQQWAAFGDAFGVTKSVRGAFGLSDFYWSADRYDSGNAKIIDFRYCLPSINGVNYRGVLSTDDNILIK